MANVLCPRDIDTKQIESNTSVALGGITLPRRGRRSHRGRVAACAGLDFNPGNAQSQAADYLAGPEANEKGRCGSRERRLAPFLSPSRVVRPAGECTVTRCPTSIQRPHRLHVGIDQFRDGRLACATFSDYRSAARLRARDERDSRGASLACPSAVDRVSDLTDESFTSSET